MEQPTTHTVVIIPARGGSKRLPGKNIRPLLGKPMIAYAIAAAKAATLVDRVIVTTDDQAIADAATHAGAEVPFLRPAELATDTATTLDVLQHAVRTLEASGPTITTVVLVQPTAPLVLASDLDAAITMLEQTKTATCVSMAPVVERPEWMYTLADGQATPFGTNHDVRSRTQDLPAVYRINGAVYATRRETLMEAGRIIDEERLSAIIMPRERSVDIDELSDFLVAETFLRATQTPS